MELECAKKVKKIAIIIIAAAVLAVRYWFALPDEGSGNIRFYLGQTLVVKGEVEDVFGADLLTDNLKLKVEEVEIMGNSYPVGGVIFASGLGFLDKLNFGDSAAIKGQLTESFYSDPRIGALMKNAKLKSIEKRERSFLKRMLFGFRNFLDSRLKQVFPQPSAGFAAALLFGAKSSIPRDVLENFRVAGLSHIIAISGYNIVLLINFLSAALAFLPFKFRNISLICFIALFAIFTGASASVVRASVMGGLSVVAKTFGRRAGGLRPLIISGYTMAFLDPLMPFYDIGFQLSFGATAGLILFAKPFQDYFEKLPNWLGMKDSLLTTLAAQVFTVPLIFYHFKNISLIAPVANIFVLPFVPYLMIGSFLALIFGKIAAAPAWSLFETVFQMVSYFASIPFASVDF